MVAKKNHEQFIEDFSQAHAKNGYQVIGQYKNSKIKIAIRCPKHGIWKATPNNLLRGQGCSTCFGKFQKTHEQFVKEFNQTHAGKGYEIVGDYTKAHNKIAIKCPIHGIWENMASKLIGGQGCKKCAGLSLRTQEEFVANFNQVHAKSGYQVVGQYKNSSTKIEIKCPKHGIWKGIPGNLLQGCGCPGCRLDKMSELLSKSHEQFLYEFNQVHAKNGYQLIGQYKNAQAKIEIKCPKHGIWKAVANSTLKGHLCPVCTNRIKTHDHFVEQFNEIHFGKNYEIITAYTKSDKAIEIKCPTHGIWKATPNSLLCGSDCPSCAKGSFKRLEEATFYLFEIIKDRVTYYGFGISNKYKIRKTEHLKNLARGDAQLVNEWLYHFDVGQEALDLETNIKALLKEQNLHHNLGIEGFQKECAKEDGLRLILQEIDRSKALKVA